MPIEPWTVTDVEHRGDFKVFDVQALRCRRSDQTDAHTFFRIGSPSWVNVVALTADGAFIMVHQFRHGVGKVTLEIPGGLVDPGEDPATAAARELLEETGYSAGTVRKIGEVSPNPALFDNRLFTYVAEGCTPVGEIENDSTEQTEVELVAPSALAARTRNGEIDHALVLAAFHWWHLDQLG